MTRQVARVCHAKKKEKHSDRMEKEDLVSFDGPNRHLATTCWPHSSLFEVTMTQE